MVYLKLVLTALFWGGTFIAGRLIAAEVTPFSAAFIRFSMASFLLVILVLRLEKRIPKLPSHHLVSVVALGLTGVFAYNFFFFSGLKLISASRAALIIANNPVAITLLSVVLLGERPGRTQISGIVLSLFGAMLVISRGDLSLLFERGIGWGEIFIFGCVVSWALYSTLGRRAMRDIAPTSLVCYSTLFGTAGLLVPALNEGLIYHLTDYSLLSWASLLYLGLFGTVIGFVWFYQGIDKLGPTRAGLFINFVPVFAIVLAYLLLDETITPSLLTGAGFVTVGVYLTNRRVGAVDKKSEAQPER